MFVRCAFLLWLVGLVGCATSVVDDPVACVGDRAKFCGPAGDELSPPPPSAEGIADHPQNEARPTLQSGGQPPALKPLLRPAPEFQR